MPSKDASRKAEGTGVDATMQSNSALRTSPSAKDQTASEEKHTEAPIGLGTKIDTQKITAVKTGDSLDVMHDKRNFANVQDAFLAEVTAKPPEDHDEDDQHRQIGKKYDTPHNVEPLTINQFPEYLSESNVGMIWTVTALNRIDNHKETSLSDFKNSPNAT